MDVTQAIVLWAAACAGGALNAVAGGGTFLTFPALMWLGLPAVAANGTSTVALWPGGAASAWGYRDRLKLPLWRALRVASVVGGVAGSLLVVMLPQRVFAAAVPALLLVASVLFTFGGRLAPVGAAGPAGGALHPALVWVQLLVSVYGGYFGGGQGFLMLAAYNVAGLRDIHDANAAKTVMASLANGAAVVTFVVAGQVSFEPAAVMLTGAVVGGYAGARLAQRVKPATVRPVVVALAWAVTARFVWTAWLR